MISNLTLRRAFFAFLIHLSMPTLLLSKNNDHEIFSISYGEDKGLKARVLSATVYNEKKETQQIKALEEDTEQKKEAIEKLSQEEIANKQKDTELALLIKKTKKRIEKKEAIEKKLLSEILGS